MRTPAHTQNEEYCPVAIHNPLTGYEPKQLDNSDYSETIDMIFQRNPATKIRSPRTRAMRNSSMSLSEKRCLHHCSLRSEKTSEPETNLSLS